MRKLSDQYLSVEQARASLGYKTRQSVYGLIRNGRLQADKSTGMVLVRRRSVEDLRRKRRLEEAATYELGLADKA